MILLLGVLRLGAVGLVRLAGSLVGIEIRRLQWRRRRLTSLLWDFFLAAL
jgi:hypothetical protein